MINNRFIGIAISEEELKILEIQKKYKNKEIFEKDISCEDKNKLIELYKKQNKELTNAIEREKHKISRMLKELKA